MSLEIWVGLVEVRQLPGEDHKIMLDGKGAIIWVTCWASSSETYESKVADVMADYGLFIVKTEDVMPFTEMEKHGSVTDKLFEQFEETSKNENFCIYGTFHGYMSDN